jgi:hypothetical protein
MARPAASYRANKRSRASSREPTSLYRPIRLRASAVYEPNGARECARRARQIAAGSLKHANGLRDPGGPLLP